MRNWTNADIDRAYFLGLIRATAIIPPENAISPTMYIIRKDIESIKALGYDNPYEMVETLITSNVEKQ